MMAAGGRRSTDHKTSADAGPVLVNRTADVQGQKDAVAILKPILALPRERRLNALVWTLRAYFLSEDR